MYIYLYQTELQYLAHHFVILHTNFILSVLKTQTTLLHCLYLMKHIIPEKKWKEPKIHYANLNLVIFCLDNTLAGERQDDQYNLF